MSESADMQPEAGDSRHSYSLASPEREAGVGRWIKASRRRPRTVPTV